MEPTDLAMLIKMAGSAGFGVAVMALALRWLDHDRRAIAALLNTEREERIKTLEERAKQCAEDRTALHREISDLQREVRSLMRGMIPQPAAQTAQTA